MGRKRKQPVSINVSWARTEVPVTSDGLPSFKRYLDVPYEKKDERQLTRWFFVAPSQEEIDDTTELHKSKKFDLRVLAASMPYMPGVQKTRPTLFEYSLRKGFSENFATDLVRLVINFLEGKHYSSATLANHAGSLEEFLDFLAKHAKKPSEISLTDIGKQVWQDYLRNKETDKRTTSKTLFNNARGFFKAYGPTTLGGWLKLVSFRESQSRKPSNEHTSVLADTRDYSDVVMYQLLALFIEAFQRRIGYLTHYENLSEADMPKNWMFPGRKYRRLQDCKGNILEGFNEEDLKVASVDTTALIFRWLSDEDEGYQTLIDHHIMHHKAGLVKRQQGNLRGGFREKLASVVNSESRYYELFREHLTKFLETMGRWHGYEHGRAIVSLLNFYVKKKTAKEPNNQINQIGYCLANLLMMQTGCNKEVVLSIPSKDDNGEPILARGDSLFVTNDGSTEIELYGIKERTGNSPRKVIPLTIVKGSPIYEMLIEYERYVKVDSDGPFFEFNKSFIDSWSKAGGITNFQSLYPVIDENGEQLASIDTTRFRKVFASGRLLEHLQGVKDGNELAEKLRDDLRHDNLDVTITNYLMRSTVGRGVIDAAIATVTAEKLEEGLRFKGRVALKQDSSIKKKVFLCDCEDPTNPSHDIAIAAECKHYDLCLGCERCVITKEHLPFICARIIQYEEERQRAPLLWPAMFEDRWNIAHDALDQYVSADKKHGQKLVDEAWAAAMAGIVSLPPIISSNRM